MVRRNYNLRGFLNPKPSHGYAALLHVTLYSIQPPVAFHMHSFLIKIHSLRFQTFSTSVYNMILYKKYCSSPIEKETNQPLVDVYIMMCIGMFRHFKSYRLYIYIDGKHGSKSRKCALYIYIKYTRKIKMSLRCLYRKKK